MIPTSIDGTDITGATIDGTDVTEITVDGQTVFSAETIIEDNFSTNTINDFSQYNMSNGNTVTNAFTVTNNRLENTTFGDANFYSCIFEGFATLSSTDSISVEFDIVNYSDDDGVGVVLTESDNDCFGYFLGDDNPNPRGGTGLGNNTYGNDSVAIQSTNNTSPSTINTLKIEYDNGTLSGFIDGILEDTTTAYSLNVDGAGVWVGYQAAGQAFDNMKITI